MRYYFLLIIVFIGLFSCGEDQQKNQRDALDRVMMVPRTPDWSFEEKGIGAVPDGDFIFLEWYLAKESAYFKEYRLERTRIVNESDFEPINFEPVASAEFYDTTYVDSVSIALGVTYYYRLAVLNVDDRYSEYSDTVFFQLGPKPSISTSIEQTDTTLDVIFSIDLNNIAIPEPVYLRIYKDNEKVLISLLDQEPFYESPSSTGKADFRFSGLEDYESGKLTTVRTDIEETNKISLLQGRVYQARVDYKGSLNNPLKNGHSGAKSQWQHFNYQPEN